MTSRAEPVPVELVDRGGTATLLRGGEPFVIRGVGGTARLDELAAAGANAIRTWDVDDGTARLLDRAEAHGLAVCLGIWFPHPRHGHDYLDEETVKGVLDHVRASVMAHRAHPAVLMWSLGNEIDIGVDDPAQLAAIYRTVERAAQMVRDLDPHHPVMAISADLGPDARIVRLLRDHAPTVQIVGFNTYGGAASIARRYTDAGGALPFVLTEFGPVGPWEVPRTPWGTPIEPSSTEKAALYRQAHDANAVDQADRCLGSFAFLWGWKQETTETWFGMLAPGGRRYAAADAMQAIWTGRPPADRVPVLGAIALDDDDARVGPGAALHASAEAHDPEGQPLTWRWSLRAAKQGLGAGGDAEAGLARFDDHIETDPADPARVTLRAPQAPGPYRLFVFVDDPNGGSATTNLPLLVE